MEQPTSSHRAPGTSSDGASSEASPLDQLEYHYAPPWQEEIKAWIREYQTAATLGSFALGVFIGVMMRR